MTEQDGVRVSVSLSQKVNLGNYESAEVFLSVSNLAAGSGPDEIDAALETGKLAYDRIRERLKVEIAAAKAGVNMGPGRAR